MPSYDIRFPELAMLYAKLGVQVLVYPVEAAPVAHEQLVERARAVDNKCFVITCPASRNSNKHMLLLSGVLQLSLLLPS
jgi:omega-amidase